MSASPTKPGRRVLGELQPNTTLPSSKPQKRTLDAPFKHTPSSRSPSSQVRYAHAGQKRPIGEVEDVEKRSGGRVDAKSVFGRQDEGYERGQGGISRGDAPVVRFLFLEDS